MNMQGTIAPLTAKPIPFPTQTLAKGFHDVFNFDRQFVN